MSRLFYSAGGPTDGSPMVSIGAVRMAKICGKSKGGCIDSPADICTQYYNEIGHLNARTPQRYGVLGRSFTDSLGGEVYVTWPRNHGETGVSSSWRPR